MEKNLYIDASHPSETRVVLKSDNNLEDYEYESLKTNLNKNIATLIFKKILNHNINYTLNHNINYTKVTEKLIK